MWASIKNIWFLAGKELKSVLGDVTLMALILIIFSISTVAVVKGITTEVKNASIAVVDEDQSELSADFISSFKAPYFQTPQNISSEDIDQLIDAGEYTFVMVIPVGFEEDLIQQHQPSIQFIADSSAVSQAGLGQAYAQQIIQQQITTFFNQKDALASMPFDTSVRTWFNPNTQTSWFTAPSQIYSNTTLLAMLLVGAAVIREKERGTIEHLLVMPVRAHEIALAKILSNSLVITIAALMSLFFVIHLWLGVPLTGSILLFTFTLIIYLFSACSLGILLATLTPTMPQFGLVCIPLYVIMRLLSGAESPLESMPEFIQIGTQISPMTHFVKASVNILSRQAHLEIIWDSLLYMSAMGVIYFTIALLRFKKMLQKQA